ncbi:MAG: holliday junction DNA helicase RuvA [Parcubacteria group bacterium Greene0416_14]|nr:MAG: holliday junction DNA helicase RuvA [Parcubacteria group bacterium Greene0416_14]TSD00457.1 MAG: holliday junction DNA helicase RuvA [Parcubacteria group bacterium Greene1014_15]TSD07869.1 MAG: holliday junction DNA helicase RuvA [Parcubacteria group bacterium Greene0714_4]
MISRLTGTAIYIGEGSLVVDVNGVGYNIHAAGEFLAQQREGSSIALWIHTAMRDSSIDLYGFKDQSDLHFFEKLISVSGIGPKSALAILALAPVATLKSAIISRDSSYLTRVSGIGKKTAEKIVFELQDKIEDTFSINSTTGIKYDSDALEALQTLGYSASSAREALQKVEDTVTDTGNRIKTALRLLGSSK